MTYRISATIIIVIFISLAVFGLYFPGHVGHGMDCPFSIGETAVCASIFSHMHHWESAFSVVLSQVLVFIGITILLFRLLSDWITLNYQVERYRQKHFSAPRPPLLQELFSAGILNRKAP